MLFPPCPLTARDRHQGKLIPPVKHGVIVRAIVTVGPLSPSCRAVLGRPARHPDRPQPESTRVTTQKYPSLDFACYFIFASSWHNHHHVTYFIK